MTYCLELGCKNRESMKCIDCIRNVPLYKPDNYEPAFEGMYINSDLDKCNNTK